MHTVDGPVIEPANGNGLMVMIFVALAVPQALETTYNIVSVPTLTPVTSPPVTVALPLLAVHIPPVAGSVKEMDAPVHTMEAPLIVPATGKLLMVIAFVADAVPHALVTV